MTFCSIHLRQNRLNNLSGAVSLSVCMAKSLFPFTAQPHSSGAKSVLPFHTLRTSDGGNGNHSVSLPTILKKIKVDKMLPSSYISSLLVSNL